ncbi:hypothetical protein DL766_010142 [Monosporascus sp. MC13-8B]|uniref:Uncharacterized protein n=1 Tax=Monosporascus cannonballus TaxID=155416 RepID=A0ABY0HGQ3_9PEZI|nr:hypothetical protein DL762_001241 [Monosporascus cannonballus]RYO99674.1 hypothetical protein DL763_001282 [Monosporascus cannonballus]RYP09431.1 hypothetical protein DL766_010142 [Monosporascus sp. MC13-8B]
MDGSAELGYNLDELDAALSDAGHQQAAVSGPPRNNPRVETDPGRRRGSLVPTASVSSRKCAAHKGERQLPELNLFHFDLQELEKDVLLTTGESQVSYHEYAVFSPPGGDPDGEQRTSSTMSEGEEALRMFHQAINNNHGLDIEGQFTVNPNGASQLKGRVRQVIADRRRRYKSSEDIEFGKGTSDGLTLTVDDYNSLRLHSATLPHIQRVTVESSFWDSKRETLHLILSFSPSPQPPYDFLSMRYDVRRRTTTALIRRSLDTRGHEENGHEEDALDEYERRLDSCRERWAHPLALPIVLVQVQLYRTEEAVVANNDEVLMLEHHVDAVTGTTGQANAEAYKRRMIKNASRPLGPLKRLSSLKDRINGGGNVQSHISPIQDEPLDPDSVPPQTIHLMKEAHDVLKGTIKLLDTLRWTERAVKLIMQAGDELNNRVKEMRRRAVVRGEIQDEDEEDELSVHWYEMRQYLDCIWRLCTSLETDRPFGLKIYSKMAQEDNNLNARMAVASTRDSSSMKALAVITALFLPGDFIGTLFGVEMFNWQRGTAGDPAESQDADDELPKPVVMPSFWVYWAVTIPLTFFIIMAWRAWWVNQDRYFRRHLSMELSNERYWTTDGKPRELETTFMEDFFSLFKRSGAASTSNRTIIGGTPVGNGRAKDARDRALTTGSREMHPQSPGLVRRGRTRSQNTSMAKDEKATKGLEGVATWKDGRFRRISFVNDLQRKDPGSVV